MHRSIVPIAISCLALAGCATSTTDELGSRSHGAQTLVRQTGHEPLQWTKFDVLAAHIGPLEDIVAGPDGSMWFSDSADSTIGRSLLDGHVSTFSVAPLIPQWIAFGGNGKLYFDQCTSQIIAMSVRGVTNKYRIPSGSPACGALVKGAEGDVWFAEDDHVARISVTGIVSEYPFTDAVAEGEGIALAPDGGIWFTEQGVNAIHRIDPRTGTIRNDDIDGAGQCGPDGITAGPDGDVWFDCTAAPMSIGHMTGSGAVSLVNVPFSVGGLKAIEVGPDGDPWFINLQAGTIAELDPASGNTYAYASPYAVGAIALAAGPDGDMWMTSPKQLSVFIRNVMMVTPTSLLMTGPRQTWYVQATETGSPELRAVSSNPQVASVIAVEPPDFAVTSVSAGKAYVTIYDPIGNSFRVPVTVQ